MPAAACAAWRPLPPPGTVRSRVSSWWDLRAGAGRTAAPRASRRWRGSGPRGRSPAPRPGARGLARRVEALETALEDLNRAIAGMREELQFVQRLLEDPTKKKRGS